MKKDYLLIKVKKSDIFQNLLFKEKYSTLFFDYIGAVFSPEQIKKYFAFIDVSSMNVPTIVEQQAKNRLATVNSPIYKIVEVDDRGNFKWDHVEVNSSANENMAAPSAGDDGSRPQSLGQEASHVEPEEVRVRFVDYMMFNGELTFQYFNSNAKSTRYRTFSVFPSDTLGAEIILAEPVEEVPTVIPDICFPSWTSFIQIVRSILISYHLEFGSFKRIKCCPVCRKLFIEQKENKKDYCSSRCRKKKAHVEVKDATDCYFRQRSWINNKKKSTDESHILPVPVDYCKHCLQVRQERVKGGECRMIIVKSIIAVESKIKGAVVRNL